MCLCNILCGPEVSRLSFTNKQVVWEWGERLAGSYGLTIIPMKGAPPREKYLWNSQDKGNQMFYCITQSHDQLQRDLSHPLILPGTGPECLCPAQKGWGWRRDVSGTSPPHWTPGMTADHRPVSETPGPSHTANPYSHCYTALLHGSAQTHRITKYTFQNTVYRN